MSSYSTSMVFLGLGLTLVLSAISVFFFRAGSSEGTSPLTRFFLVALRLSIGWHFFVEGMDKLHNASWSSEAYLREATGPLAPKFREMAGDRLLAKLTLGEGDSFPPELDAEWRAYLEAVVSSYGLDADQAKHAHAVFEDAKKKTTDWLKTWAKPVQLTSDPPVPMTIPERIKTYHALEKDMRGIEEVQLPKYGSDAFPKYKTAKANLNKWRGELKADLDRQTAEYKTALRDRVLVVVALGALPPEQQFKALDAKIREMEAKVKAAGVVAKYDKGGLTKNLKAVQENLAKLRAELKSDLDQKAPLKPVLRDQILAEESLAALPEEYHFKFQEAKEPLATIQAAYSTLLTKRAAGETIKLPDQAIRVFEYALDKRQDKQDPSELLPAGTSVPTRSVGSWTMLDWSDFLVKWGVLVTGVCLLIGFLTRTACIAGAGLLLMFFLAMPPLPGWPESPRAEGHYLFINKNIIEMLALLTLATTRSGRWAGLDGLCQFLCPWCWKSEPPPGRLEKVVSLGEEPTLAIDPVPKHKA